MDKQKIRQLLDIINELVDDTSLPYSKKKDMIVAEMEGDRDSMNLEEFISWFPDES